MGIGPFDTGSGLYDHGVVETPWAVWIVSQGELIRLDRVMLDKILKP